MSLHSKRHLQSQCRDKILVFTKIKDLFGYFFLSCFCFWSSYLLFLKVLYNSNHVLPPVHISNQLQIPQGKYIYTSLYVWFLIYKLSVAYLLQVLIEVMRNFQAPIHTPSFSKCNVMAVKHLCQSVFLIELETGGLQLY